MNIVCCYMNTLLNAACLISTSGISSHWMNLRTAESILHPPAKRCSLIKLLQRSNPTAITNRNMKHKIFFYFLIMTLLTACSSGQATTPNVPIQLADVTPHATRTPDSDAQTFIPTATIPASTSTPKPPLAKDAWKQMPVVPVSVSERAIEIYELGLTLGNDPTHFSIIGDCQNVSSYFLSTFDKPGDFSLGSEYAYLQPTIEYFQGSYSRT